MYKVVRVGIMKGDIEMMNKVRRLLTEYQKLLKEPDTQCLVRELRSEFDSLLYDFEEAFDE